jgi:hypothetical protein
MRALVLGLAAIFGCGDDTSPAADAGGRDASRDSAVPDEDAATDAGGSDAGRACTPVAPHEIAPSAGIPRTSSGVALAAADVGYGVAWQANEGMAARIEFARLDAAGALMGSVVRITDGEGVAGAPSLVWTGAEFALVWHDDRDGNNEIYFTRVSSAGAEVGADARITNDGARSEFPSLAWNGDGFGVAWNDTRDSGFQIYFVRLGAAGTRMGGDVRVTSDTMLGASPWIASNGTGYGVAWHDTRDMMGLQIYFARLDAAGAVMGAQQRLTADGANGGNARVAWSGTEYGVEWQGTLAAGGAATFARVAADGTASTAVEVADTGSVGDSLARRGAAWAVSYSAATGSDRDVFVVDVDATGMAGEPIPVSNDSNDSFGSALAMAGDLRGRMARRPRDGDDRHAVLRDRLSLGTGSENAEAALARIRGASIR